MNIEELRDKINTIDDEMLKLFLQRMNVTLDIAKYKKENGLPVLNSARERQILNRISKDSGETFENYSRVLFSTLFDLSKSYQSTVLRKDKKLSQLIENAKSNMASKLNASATVACQGVEGAYSSIAAENIFSSPCITYMNSFDGVFNAVDKGLCKYGVLPIENSTAGSVGNVYDLMKKYNFYIVESKRLKIDHCLLAKNGVGLKDIKEIYSHEQAVNQCSEFLEKHKDIKINIVENTAVAASMVSESNRNDVAAIASSRCGELYSLNTVTCDVQNTDNNYTRFICISKNLEILEGADKISFMATLPHKPGSLYNLISKFAARGLNLTKLESRTIKGKDFEFMFYFDFKASIMDDDIISLMTEIEDSSEEFTFLGGYKEQL